RPLVADHDDVARPDAAGLHRLERVLLAVEHARWAAVPCALVADELHHAAVRREVAAQDGDPAAVLDRPVERPHHLLARRLARAGGFFGDRAAGDRRRAPIDEPGLE